MEYPDNILFDLDDYSDVAPYSQPGEDRAALESVLSGAIARFDTAVADIDADAGERFETIRRAARSIESAYDDLRVVTGGAYPGALVHR